MLYFEGQSDEGHSRLAKQASRLVWTSVLVAMAPIRGASLLLGMRCEPGLTRLRSKKKTHFSKDNAEDVFSHGLLNKAVDVGTDI